MIVIEATMIDKICPDGSKDFLEGSEAFCNVFSHPLGQIFFSFF